MKRVIAAVLAFLILFGVDSYACDRVQGDEAPYVRYAVAGHELPVEISQTLQEYLAQEGIEWWMYYACLQAYQESSYDICQLTPYPGGNDCGLFQFRDQFWADHCQMAGVYGDIMDWRVQCRVYARITAQRLRAGRSIEQVISDWTTGGEDRICEEYVRDVMRWESRTERVR